MRRRTRARLRRGLCRSGSRAGILLSGRIWAPGRRITRCPGGGRGGPAVPGSPTSAAIQRRRRGASLRRSTAAAKRLEKRSEPPPSRRTSWTSSMIMDTSSSPRPPSSRRSIGSPVSSRPGSRDLEHQLLPAHAGDDAHDVRLLAGAVDDGVGDRLAHGELDLEAVVLGEPVVLAPPGWPIRASRGAFPAQRVSPASASAGRSSCCSPVVPALRLPARPFAYPRYGAFPTPRLADRPVGQPPVW